MLIAALTHPWRLGTQGVGEFVVERFVCAADQQLSNTASPRDPCDLDAQPAPAPVTEEQRIKLVTMA